MTDAGPDARAGAWAPRVAFLGRPGHSLGSTLAFEVTQLELARRLADVVVDLRVPGGDQLDRPIDGAIVDDGALTEADCAALAGQLAQQEAFAPAFPVVWQGVRSRSDQAAPARPCLELIQRGRLVTTTSPEERARLQAECGDIRVNLHPDLGVLTPRLVPSPVAERRLRTMRDAGILPREGEFVLAEVGSSAVATALAKLDTSDDLIILQNGGRAAHGAGASERARTLPQPVAPEDVAAAMVAARTVIASSVPVAAMAFAYGRPWLALPAPGDRLLSDLAATTGDQINASVSARDLASALGWQGRVPPNRTLLGPIQARLDSHFDRVAEAVEQAAWARRRAPEDRGGLGPRSHEPIDMTAYSEGLALTGLHERLAHDEREAVALRADEIGHFKARAFELEQQLQDLQSTRTFRYTRRARHVWLRMLQLTGQR